MNIPLIYLYMIIYGVCLFALKFVIQLVGSLFKSKSNECCTNISIQYYLWILSIHSYSSLFSWSVRYSNLKSNECCTNIFIHDYLWSLFIHSYSRYLVRKFVIQIVKIMNIALIY